MESTSVLRAAVKRRDVLRMGLAGIWASVLPGRSINRRRVLTRTCERRTSAVNRSSPLPGTGRPGC
jgi:hypothetical protein